MEKTGELKEGVSRCDVCGQEAYHIVGDRAYCEQHFNEEFRSQKSAGLKSFTEELA